MTIKQVFLYQVRGKEGGRLFEGALIRYFGREGARLFGRGRLLERGRLFEKIRVSNMLET